MHGHGQVSNRLYREIVSSCPESDLKSGSLDSKCQSLVEEMNKAVGPYYSYNLYDTCYAQNIFDLRSRTYWSSSPTLTGAVNDYPCAGPALNIYINRTDVRTALSVPTDSFYFRSVVAVGTLVSYSLISGDNGAGFVYNTTEKNLLPFYLDTIRKNQLRVLIYNGDAGWLLYKSCFFFIKLQTRRSTPLLLKTSTPSSSMETT